MTRGLRVPSEVRQVLPAASPTLGATGHALFGSAGDLDLSLPSGCWVSVPVIAGLAATTPYTLSHGPNGFAITAEGAGDHRMHVNVHPPSRFFRSKTSAGIPFGRVGTVHGPYLALSPTNYCTFITAGVEAGSPADARCRFCAVRAQGDTRDGLPVDDVIEAIRIARGGHPIHIVYLSVGDLGTADGGVRFLEPYVEAIKKHFDILVAVDALPPRAPGWIDRTYGMGVDAVSYNLEIWGKDRFARVCPGPARAIGRQRFVDALTYAATVFPSGAVTCHLIVGLEPLAATREGIDALTDVGVLPILPVYRPFKGRDMRADADIELFCPTLDELVGLHAHLYRAMRRHKLNPHLVRDIAVVTTPVEGRFFTQDTGFWSSLRYRVMGSGLGRRASTHLSDLRRALRARQIEGAGES